MASSAPSATPAASGTLRFDDRRALLLGIPLVGLLITALTAGHAAWSSVAGFLGNYGVALTYTTVLWLGTRTIWLRLLRRLPAVAQTARRLLWLVTLCLLYNLTASVGLMAFFRLWMPLYFALTPAAVLTSLRLNLIPTTIVLLVYESRYFFLNWAYNVRRAEQLQSAATRAQLEALQQQLDPHFLFNSLNTLAALVEPDNAPAQEFVEQLADVYRYVLLSRERSTVPLREELTFVDAYVALQKARLRDNLHVAVHIPAHLLDRHVAPLSVQLLIENALKHNEASRRHPLHVTVSADDNGLTVSNLLRHRGPGLAPPGTGTGLRNIRERYALLAPAHPVQVQDQADRFVVRLPLI